MVVGNMQIKLGEVPEMSMQTDTCDVHTDMADMPATLITILRFHTGAD